MNGSAQRFGVGAAVGTLLGILLSGPTAAAFVANGPVSILGALLTAARPGWAMSTLGLILGALWNLLLAVMAALALVAFRRRLPAAPAWTLRQGGARS